MIVLYHNPKCSKSREAFRILSEAKLDFIVVDYVKDGLNEKELEKIWDLMPEPKSQMIRTQDEQFKLQSCDIKSKNSVVDLLALYPSLLERPLLLVEADKDFAFVARPPEKVYDLIKQS